MSGRKRGPDQPGDTPRSAVAQNPASSVIQRPVLPSRPAPWRQWIRAAVPDANEITAPRSESRRQLDRFVELQQLLLVAIAFSLGIWGYFRLPEEPDAIFVLVLFLLCASVALQRWYVGKLGLSSLLVLAVFGGMAGATLRTSLVEAPRMSAAATVTVTGRVVSLGWTERGQRVVLDVAGMEVPAYAVKDGVPERVRLTVPRASTLAVGEGISVRARLFPPSGPVRPGGYDYAFTAYFQGIGGTGYAYGRPDLVELGPQGWIAEAHSALQRLRSAIAERIAGLSRNEETAGIAIALLVGDRDRITEEAEDSLRQAGLAHILAISGLHMALFAGGAYTVFLFALALSPAAALTWPIHRIAALAALGAATAYLALSGASVATQRSYLMIALVFLGILVGRRGLTLRSVALAALVLLLAAPERLFHPGFQMSFAAVFCLVAAYDQLRQNNTRFIRAGQASGALGKVARKTGLWVSGLFITAVVAGLATGIVGAHHFGRIAPYGLVGNMLGMPVFSLIVMPMGVLTLLALPLGLAAYPLAAMEVGLDLVLAISRFTAGLDSGEGHLVPPGAGAALGLFAALGLGLILPVRFKVAALMPIALAGGALGLSRPPDVHLSDRGSSVAARDQDGILRFSARRAGFATEMWLQAEGLPPAEFAARKMAAPQRRCDESGCVVHAYAGSGTTGHAAVPLRIAFPKTADALADDCRYADAVVTDLAVGAWCRAGLVLSGADRTRAGAVSLWLELDLGEDGEWKTQVSHVRHAKGRPPRPWHR